MTRRKSSWKQRWFNILGVGVLLYGTTFVAYTVMHLLFTYAFGGR